MQGHKEFAVQDRVSEQGLCERFLQYQEGILIPGSHRRMCMPVLILQAGREVNGAPLQYFCLENPMDEGAW